MQAKGSGAFLLPDRPPHSLCLQHRLRIHVSVRLTGHVQVEVSGGRLATQGYSGGAETQIAFERRGFHYVVYDRLIRTEFGSDGRHSPEQSSGVLILKGGTLVADRACKGPSDYTIDGKRAMDLPEGPFTEQ